MYIAEYNIDGTLWLQAAAELVYPREYQMIDGRAAALSGELDRVLQFVRQL